MGRIIPYIMEKKMFQTTNQLCNADRNIICSNCCPKIRAFNEVGGFSQLCRCALRKPLFIGVPVAPTVRQAKELLQMGRQCSRKWGFQPKTREIVKKTRELTNKQRTTILDIWGIPIKCRSFAKLDSDQTSSLIARGQWRNSHKTNLQNRNSQALIQEMETSAPVDLSGLSGHWLEHLGTLLPTLILSSQYEVSGISASSSGILVRSAW